MCFLDTDQMHLSERVVRGYVPNEPLVVATVVHTQLAADVPLVIAKPRCAQLIGVQYNTENMIQSANLSINQSNSIDSRP